MSGWWWCADDGVWADGGMWDDGVWADGGGMLMMGCGQMVVVCWDDGVWADDGGVC